MSRFSVAAIINWSYHYSTERSPYSWKLFWHNWFTLTSVYLFIATVSPGQQSLRGERCSQTCVPVPEECTNIKTCVTDRKSLRLGLINITIFHHQSPAGKNTPGKTHLRAAAAAAAVGHQQGQAQLSFGGTQQLLEPNYNWAPGLLSSKLVLPY